MGAVRVAYTPRAALARRARRRRRWRRRGRPATGAAPRRHAGRRRRPPDRSSTGCPAWRPPRPDRPARAAARPGALVTSRGCAGRWLPAWSTAPPVVAGEVGAGRHAHGRQLAAGAAGRPRRPAVVTVHDVAGARPGRTRAGSACSCACGTRRRHAGHGARAVAVSEATAAPLRALGLDVVVRPNGVTWPVARSTPACCTSPRSSGCSALLTPWNGSPRPARAAALAPRGARRAGRWRSSPR